MTTTGDGAPLIDCALKHLSYGVYVVSAGRRGSANAMTMHRVAQVSTRPALIAVAMNRVRHTHAFIEETRAFVVNVLGAGQQLLGGHFGFQSGRDVDKLAGVACEIGVTGAPILQDCCAYVECKLVAAHEVGDSTLFIGEVVHAGVRDRPPLLFREADYFG